jgi:alanyl-tRNA synthetase
MWTSDTLRKKFLDYFASKQHQNLQSASLIPSDDSSVLFNVAGMMPLKPYYLGEEIPPSPRVVTIQRCLRAGGKHNDLENVGYTERHHTFFEMMGNFCWGDYLKKDAIAYAWEFLTEILKLPKERLWITVHKEDRESEDIWLRDIKVDPARFSRCTEDNFWAMGDTGPCGPCSEIFYDWGAQYPGGPPGSGSEDARYVELWNLVFMQYQRTQAGELIPLPKPAIDTGMGLERLAAVMQGVHSNYETDLFKPLLQAISDLSHEPHLFQPRLQVIADHIRACTFLISDGIRPSNEGRGYVLRRIIRRALRNGYQIGLALPFFYRLVPEVISIMGNAYPELVHAGDQIQAILRQEEEQFAHTLVRGFQLLTREIEQLITGSSVPGDVIFKLYDTHGVPVDLIADVARENGLTLDLPGFERCMALQRQRAKSASQFISKDLHLIDSPETQFKGYETRMTHAVIQSLFKDEQPVEQLELNDSGIVVLDETPFYAQAGGQVGDQGKLYCDDGEFIVQDTQKRGSHILHIGRIARGSFRQHQSVIAKVDQQKRQATACNHTATHLLHAALRRVLGDQVMQKGSLVQPERLRFDFSYSHAVSMAQLATIERLVNQQIANNIDLETHVMELEQAQQRGVLALFGEKYGQWVRVLQIGDFSQELCGGTHVRRTGEIGFFKIISEVSIAAQVRRIEALTGDAAVQWVLDLEHRWMQISNLLKTNSKQLVDKVAQQISKTRALEKQIDQLHTQIIAHLAEELIKKADVLHGVSFLSAIVQLDSVGLSNLMEHLKGALKNAVIILVACVDDQMHWIIGVSENNTHQISAQILLKKLMQSIDGKGGGRADLAKGVSPKCDDVDRIFLTIRDEVFNLLDKN